MHFLLSVLISTLLQYSDDVQRAKWLAIFKAGRTHGGKHGKTVDNFILQALPAGIKALPKADVEGSVVAGYTMSDWTFVFYGVLFALEEKQFTLTTKGNFSEDEKALVWPICPLDKVNKTAVSLLF